MTGQDIPPPAKPKLSAEERRAREADQLTAIRLRVMIGRELENRGIEDPAEIGVRLGTSPRFGFYRLLYPASPQGISLRRSHPQQILAEARISLVPHG